MCPDPADRPVETFLVDSGGRLGYVEAYGSVGELWMAKLTRKYGAFKRAFEVVSVDMFRPRDKFTNLVLFVKIELAKS